MHPLPPDGPVTFVAAWLLYGVAETRVELDGSAIRAAAARAVILWPEQPESEPGNAWTAGAVTVGHPDGPGATTEPDQPSAQDADAPS